MIIEVVNGVINPDNEKRKIAVCKLDELRKDTPILVYYLLNIVKGI